MSMVLLSLRPSGIVRVALAAVAVAATLSLASCNRLRSPEQLLSDPASRIDPRIAARAKELYQKNCGVCHGETGEGDGQYFASGLEPTPADLTRGGPESLDLAGVVRWIREGSAGFGRSKLCPPWGHTLTNEETTALAHFVLSLRDAKPAPADSQPGDAATGDT